MRRGQWRGAAGITLAPSPIAEGEGGIPLYLPLPPIPSPCQKPRDFLRFLVTHTRVNAYRAPHATGIPYACGKGPPLGWPYIF